MTAARVRAFTIADFDAAIALWKNIEGLYLNEADTREGVSAFLQRNPGISAVAEENGVLIGAVLCGHNGRAGHLYHLAVADTHRGQGIGRALTTFCTEALLKAGVARCNIFVYSNNADGMQFWETNGWVAPTTWEVMQKRLN